GAPIPTESVYSSARDSADDAVRRDFANALVVRVGDEQVAGGIEGDSLGISDFSCRRRTAVSGKTTGPIAHDRADDAIRRYQPYSIIDGVGNEQIARCVHGDSR